MASRDDEAVTLLAEALESAGAPFVRTETADTHADLVLTLGTRRLPVQIERWAIFPEHAVRTNPAFRRTRDEDGFRVVVTDRIGQEARRALQDAGWGWLDRRGTLHLEGSGIFIHADVPPSVNRPGPREPLRTPAGLAVACALLGPAHHKSRCSHTRRRAGPVAEHGVGGAQGPTRRRPRRRRCQPPEHGTVLGGRRRVAQHAREPGRRPCSGGRNRQRVPLDRLRRCRTDDRVGSDRHPRGRRIRRTHRHPGGSGARLLRPDSRGSPTCAHTPRHHHTRRGPRHGPRRARSCSLLAPRRPQRRDLAMASRSSRRSISPKTPAEVARPGRLDSTEPWDPCW